MPNSRRPLSRVFSIHSGSLLRAEMSRTTSSDRPRRAVAPATSESAQPNLYVPMPSSCGFAGLDVSGGHRCPSGSASAVVGRWLVRAWCRSGRRSCRRASPWAIVASRWTWPPSSRANASVSASHSCGNSRGDVLHRAVTLAQLGAAGAHRAGAGGVAVGGQRRGQGVGAGRDVAAGGLDDRGVARLELGDPGARRTARPRPARLVGQEPQRDGGQVVVRRGQRCVAGVGRGRRPGPGGRGRAGRRRRLERCATRPSASRLSRCRRTAALVRPSRSASSLAVTGPSSETAGPPGRGWSCPTAGLAAAVGEPPCGDIHNTSVT